MSRHHSVLARVATCVALGLTLSAGLSGCASTMHDPGRNNHKITVSVGGDGIPVVEPDTVTAKEGDKFAAVCTMPCRGAITASSSSVIATTACASREFWRKRSTAPTTGHLFERRHRARLVDSDRYRLALVRYIHLNPVRARMVAEPRDYPWSSHRAYLGGTCPGWRRIAAVLGMFGAPIGPVASTRMSAISWHCAAATTPC